MDYSIITSMDVAGFVISIIALIFSMLALGLALRAIYIIGVNAGLANKKPAVKTKISPKQTQAEPKKPIRIDGEKIIYNEDPLVYVIENFISEEECDHFVDQSKDKLERAKTIGGKDGIYHEKRTGMNCWIPHAHSEASKAIGDRVAELIGFPLRNAESYQVVYYTGGTEYNDHHDAFSVQKHIHATID